MNGLIEAIKGRWPSVVVAAASVLALFGIEIGAVEVEHTTQLGLEVIAAIAGFYAAARVWMDKATGGSA